MIRLQALVNNQRLRHALLATGIALLVGVLELLAPLDGQIWSAQALSVPRAASGDIVFVGASGDVTDPAGVRSRQDLARLITAFETSGAARIFLNVPIDRAGRPDVDNALGDAIARSDRVVLVQRYATTVAGERTLQTIPAIARSARQVVSKEYVDPFGYTWAAPRTVTVDGVARQSLPAAVAGTSGAAQGEFPIDYSIAYDSIPKFTSTEALAKLAGPNSPFAGKVVVIGNGGTDSASYRAIPGHPRVPLSLVAITAAETLKAGPPYRLGWFFPVLGMALALMLLGMVGDGARWRRVGYTMVAVLPAVAIVALPYLRIVAPFSPAGTLLVVFAGLRLWEARRTAAALVDQTSGLPSFHKLELDLAERDGGSASTVIVGKIHQFDEVSSLLSAEDQRAYIRLVAARLKITDQRMTVYSNGGRYVAWTQEADDKQHMQAHLRGLRAIFSHPLRVGENAIDVGVTFGVDGAIDRSPAHKIARAILAAEKTNEAHQPVLFADELPEHERLWNVSLQAKIDEALRSGEIYVVYQPQVDLRSGAMIGAEALVRWRDRERGDIPPAYFIEQCEHAGRMGALTRKVLQDSVAEVSASPLLATPFQLSVNISATMLNDFQVVDMVQQVLAKEPLPAARLTLEVTETSRIADFEQARAVMNRLQGLGVRLSADDFGVGAASLETFLLLPFDELKIDRLFVSKVQANAKALALVESLSALGKHLNIVVLAEGVEDAHTLDILKRAGCHIGQGYALGMPGELGNLTEEMTVPAALQRRVY